MLPVGVAMTPDVHLSKATDVPHASHIDGEIAKEINNVGGSGAKHEKEYERSQNGRDEFFQ